MPENHWVDFPGLWLCMFVNAQSIILSRCVKTGGELNTHRDGGLTDSRGEAVKSATETAFSRGDCIHEGQWMIRFVKQKIMNETPLRGSSLSVPGCKSIPNENGCSLTGLSFCWWQSLWMKCCHLSQPIEGKMKKRKILKIFQQIFFHQSDRQEKSSPHKS